VNDLLATPLPLRLLLLFVIGALAGAITECIAERLRLERSMSPAAVCHRRTLWAGALTGLAVAALYWWEVERLGLLTTAAVAAPNGIDPWALHAQFAAHVLLFLLMLMASLVDIAERTIPDAITVPGTLAGLALAALFPISLLPFFQGAGGVGAVTFLTVGSPGSFPVSLGPHPVGLAVAILLYGGWCFALLPYRWRGRHGARRGMQLALARLARDPMTRIIAGLAVLGAAAIIAVWFYGGDHWAGLMSALVGLAVGAAMIWAVRLIGGWSMGREAMGFGDVILMAMIGSFLGWQAMPIVFFLAPVFGLVIGVIQWIRYRDNVLPYGPFLCLASAGVVVCWAWIWSIAEPYFALSGLVPTVMVLCVGLLILLLGLLKFVRGGLRN